MEYSNTMSEIETVEIASEDVITVLAEVAEYHATHGSVGMPTMVVQGTGSRRMARPKSEAKSVTNVRFDATLLVDSGSFVDTVPLRGRMVSIDVV